MPTILRIKRRRNEEPANLLVVGTKRRKIDEEKSVGKETTESRFRLAGSFNTNQPFDKKVLKNTLLKRKAEEEPTSTNCSENSKSPVVKQAKSETPLLNFEFADLEEADGDQQKEKLEINWKTWKSSCKKSDGKVEQSSSDMILCNGEPMVRSKTTTNSDYVYDFYCGEEKNTNSNISIDDFLYVKPYVEVEMVPDDDEDDNVYADDDDDSNDENNWRNDYPEEEDSDNDSDDLDYSGGSSQLNRSHYNSSMDDYLSAHIASMRLRGGFADSDDDEYS